MSSDQYMSFANDDTTLRTKFAPESIDITMMIASNSDDDQAIASTSSTETMNDDIPIMTIANVDPSSSPSSTRTSIPYSATTSSSPVNPLGDSSPSIFPSSFPPLLLDSIATHSRVASSLSSLSSHTLRLPSINVAPTLPSSAPTLIDSPTPETAVSPSFVSHSPSSFNASSSLPSFIWPHSAHLGHRPPIFAANGIALAHNAETTTPIGPVVVSVVAAAGTIARMLGGKDDKVRCTVLLNDQGRVGYQIDVASTILSTSASSVISYAPFLPASYLDLRASNRRCTFHIGSIGARVHYQLAYGTSDWRPVPRNERREFSMKYKQITVWCEGPNCVGCDFAWEIRLYERPAAIAIRALVDGESLDLNDNDESDADDDTAVYVKLDFSMTVTLPTETDDSFCWAQNNEDPYVKTKCSDWHHPVMTPMTIELNDKSTNSNSAESSTSAPSSSRRFQYMSILQADGPSFVQSTMRSVPSSSSSSSISLIVVAHGDMPIHALSDDLGVVDHAYLGLVSATSWTAIIFAVDAIDLVIDNALPYMLCSPPSLAHPNMIDTRWITHGKLIRLRTFTTINAIALIDFASNHNYHTAHFDAGWYGPETNRSSDPHHVATSLMQHLDIGEVAKYSNDNNVTVSLYVNDIALDSALSLSALYSSWSVSSFKFGFVSVSSPRLMRLLHTRVLSFAHVGISVNIHDYYRPRGLTRTYPSIVTQEGVRGQERKPDADHHTLLPFIRFIAGAADYTPRYLLGSGLRVTRCHQLALPIVLFSPIQSLFWAEPIDAIVRATELYQPELVVWESIDTVWDDTRVLGGRIGEWLAIARRNKEGEWYVGAITNTEARSVQLNLTMLFDSNIDGGSHPLLAAVDDDDDHADVDDTDDSDINAIPHLHRCSYLLTVYDDDPLITIDPSLPDTSLNQHSIRKYPRRYILTSAMSSAIERDTSEERRKNKKIDHDRGIETRRDKAEASSYDAESIDAVNNWRIERSRKRIERAAKYDQRMNRMHIKQHGTPMPAPTILESMMFTINMAPSGGTVMTLTPIVDT